MSRFPSSALALLFLLPAGAGEIPQGTHVLLRMMNSITTRTAQAGDTVYMQTGSPIVAAGGVVVPVNSYITGIVSNAKPGGRVKGRAELGIRIETLTLPSGKTVKISPHLTSVDANDSGQKVITTKESEIQQGSSYMQDAARIAILAGSGTAIGGLADRSWKGAGIGAGAGSAVGLATVLLTRGPDVELPRGSTFDVVFDRPVTIE